MKQLGFLVLGLAAILSASAGIAQKPVKLGGALMYPSKNIMERGLTRS